MFRKSPRRIVLAICVLAGIVRLGAFVYLDRFRHPQTWESETIATSLLAGNGFVFEALGIPYRSWMEPLYPSLCAFVYRLTDHSFVALGLVQILLGSILVWLVFVCARHVVPEAAALVAALLTALDPALVVYTTQFHPFVLDTFLWCAVFGLVLRFSPDHPWRSTCVIGLLIGLSVLTRPTILVCLPMIGWWTWRRSRDRAIETAAQFVVLLVCTAAVVAPWVWRNYELHSRFMLTRSNTPFVFWLGNNPYVFTGSAMTPDGGAIVARVPATVQEDLRHLDELGQQDYFQREATAFVRSHPAEFVRRWAVKFRQFWWFSPQSGLLYPAAWLRAYKIGYVALLTLAAVGVWACWRARSTAPSWQAALFILGCLLSIALVQSAYYVEGRHRLAIEPFLLIFSGGGIHHLMHRRVFARG